MVWQAARQSARHGKERRGVGSAGRHAQCAKMPFLPLLEKLAEKPVLYGVLSLLKRTCANETQSAPCPLIRAITLVPCPRSTE